jgi:3-oxoadipate enol-lactonase
MPSELFTDVTGPENAPAIVFCHALGGDLSMWDRQVAIFADRYRVLRYDVRGHGRSPEARSSLKLEDLGADVLELLDDQHLNRAHFCGLSLGGLVGQWLGLNAPERLLGLVLADTAPRMVTPEQWNERIQQIERHGMSAMAGATMERWFTERFRKAEPEIVAHVRSILENTSPAGYIACAKVVREGLVGDVAEISVPTLVMTGSFDTAAKPEDSKKMAAQIAGSQYVELDAAHISPIEASDQFNHALAAFMEEQPKAASSGR